MSVFKEDSGKISSKRVIAIGTVVIVLGIVLAKIFTDIKVSDTLILGLFGEAVLLLGISRFGGHRHHCGRTVGGELPETDDEKTVGGELPKDDDEC